MTKKSDIFEKQIERIHRLIEQKGSQITWNDKIPDPDNPNKPRQIDITIKRGGKLTLVECRIHKKPQNVKWIEELMGRRISLQADALIAVSASGFTKGAILKSQKYGIILRDLKTLSDDEIKRWGMKTHIILEYWKYRNIFFDVVFDCKFEGQVKESEVCTLLKKENIARPYPKSIFF